MDACRIVQHRDGLRLHITHFRNSYVYYFPIIPSWRNICSQLRIIQMWKWDSWLSIYAKRGWTCEAKQEGALSTLRMPVFTWFAGKHFMCCSTDCIHNVQRGLSTKLHLCSSSQSMFCSLVTCCTNTFGRADQQTDYRWNTQLHQRGSYTHTSLVTSVRSWSGDEFLSHQSTSSSTLTMWVTRIEIPGYQ